MAHLFVEVDIELKVWPHYKLLIQGDTSGCAKPPIDFKTKFPLWPGQARPGQNGFFVLMSTGGFAQRDGSPCSVNERV